MHQLFVQSLPVRLPMFFEFSLAKILRVICADFMNEETEEEETNDDASVKTNNNKNSNLVRAAWIQYFMNYLAYEEFFKVITIDNAWFILTEPAHHNNLHF